MRRSRTLFARTGITLAISLAAFLLFSVAVIFNYILVPVATRAADDLAALMVLSAQTWVELPPETRPFLESELLEDYQLKVAIAKKPLPPSNNPLPYLHFLEEALQKRTGAPATIRTRGESNPWYCVDLPMGGRVIRVSFPRSRIGSRPPIAAFLIIAAGAVVILLTSLLLVRRLTRPLARLSDATSLLGRGETLQPLPETGPRELVDLTRNFNRMAGELSELVENRTTLLAGISHDLRTPLTRMRLALEMLQQDQDDSLVKRLQHDMEEMDHLIGHAMELARGLEGQESEEVDLHGFIDGIIANYRKAGNVIEWAPGICCLCTVDTVALQRVVINLIDNAIRYGEQKPVTVDCHCLENHAMIHILDRGKGIPASERQSVFRPFHRLETSRSRSTGGSGLGLPIARQLCHANHWKIELHPRTGGGTNAVVRIPLNPEAPQENQ